MQAMLQGGLSFLTVLWPSVDGWCVSEAAMVLEADQLLARFSLPGVIMAQDHCVPQRKGSGWCWVREAVQGHYPVVLWGACQHVSCRKQVLLPPCFKCPCFDLFVVV
jgi:hypothetical protein